MQKRTGRSLGLNLAAAGTLTAVLGAACTTATAPPPCPVATPKGGAAGAPTPVTGKDESSDIPERLAAEHISPVIAAAAASVKRRCWQPALDARAADAPTSARVLLKAQIEPSGQVSAVHTEEASSAYPQLADCAAGVVRTLTFPRALSPTTANIPFIFDS